MHNVLFSSLHREHGSKVDLRDIIQKNGYFDAMFWPHKHAFLLKMDEVKDVHLPARIHCILQFESDPEVPFCEFAEMLNTENQPIRIPVYNAQKAFDAHYEKIRERLHVRKGVLSSLGILEGSSESLPLAVTLWKMQHFF